MSLIDTHCHLFSHRFPAGEVDGILERAQQAEALAANRPRVESEDGIARAASLRTYRYAEVADATAAAKHYAKHPDLIAAIEKIANAEIRAAKGEAVSIPGVTVREEKRIA